MSYSEETRAQIAKIDKQIALLPAFFDRLDIAYRKRRQIPDHPDAGGRMAGIS